MRASNLLLKLNLSMNSAARRTMWKVSLPLLFLALIVYALSRPMQASRSGFATGTDPAAAQQAIACGQTLSGNITVSGQQVTNTFNGQANERKTLTLMPNSPVNQSLVCGALLSDTIGAAGEVDQFTFSGEANEKKTLTLAASGFPFQVTATATVFSPTAAVVVTFNANSQQQLTLPESGAYVIQVRASNLVSTGSYSIGLECLLPTSPVDKALVCGSLFSGAIDASAKVDQLTFAGQANQKVTLTLGAGGFPFQVTATATVFSPTAAVVKTFNANSQQQLTLPESGTYVIQVYASNLVSTGSYSIGLECLLPTSPVDKALVCGTLFSGTIDASAKVDQLTFAGQTNQKVTLTLGAGGFPFQVTATATVFSPTAAVVKTFNANSQQQLTLPETGTYVIQVYASNLVSTGSYSLGLECLLPTSPVDATLVCGALLSSRLIETAAQVDQITFSGQTNQRVTLTLTASGFPFQVTATATLFSPTAVAVVTFNANSQQQLTLSEAGTYVIQIYASNLVSTGSYSLGLQCLLPPITLTPNPLTITAGASGNMTVTINPAQSAPAEVTLTSSNTSIVTVPSSTTIPGNATSASFAVAGVAAGTATITATLPPNPGGSATAGVTVSAPTQTCLPNSLLPGGFRPFSQVYYITGPNAGGDRLVVGKTPPDQRQLLNAVPLPNQPNQRFCDPVELASGLLAIAFVPTPGERNGDFSSFAGLLLDPVNNNPFPNGLIPANRLGDPYAWRIVNQVGAPALVSAASYSAVDLAVESIAAIFGTRLATGTQVATSLPLPTTLEGSTVKVRDSAGVTRDAPLFFVSPDQINFLVPPGTANGIATVTITSGNGSISISTTQIARVAPGLFAANANGRDVAAAVAVRVKADGAQIFEPVARFDPAQNRFVAAPVDLGPETDQVFLVPFGTGFRFRSSLSAVTVKIGGADMEVLYAGEAPGFNGLDQLNVRLSRSLIGRGEVDVALTVDGKAANVVRVNVK